MKNFSLIIMLVLTVQFTNAQVGIGTKNPQEALHVKGTILVQSDINITSLPFATSTDENFKLLTRVRNASLKGEVKLLNPNSLNVAPINTIDYHFKDLKADNLTDIDLQYDTSKYIVGIANLRYVGDAINKIDVESGTKTSIGQFVSRTFERNGTWHLEIRNRNLDIASTDQVEYFVTVIVYDKSYFRQLSTITTDMSGLLTGTASSTPTLN